MSARQLTGATNIQRHNKQSQSLRQMAIAIKPRSLRPHMDFSMKKKLHSKSHFHDNVSIDTTSVFTSGVFVPLKNEIFRLKEGGGVEMTKFTQSLNVVISNKLA